MCKKDFRAKDQKTYQIKLDDDGTDISVFYENRKLGFISLYFIEYDLEENSHYHITNLALEECKHRGLGRECLVFHKSIFGYSLTAGGQFAGESCVDGSHLTGDGVGFIYKMRLEKVVEPDPDSEDTLGDYEPKSDAVYGFL